MNQRGVLRCLLAAVLFGAAAPAASELADSLPAFTLAGLLYLGAALAVAPSTARRPPTGDAIGREWKPVALAVFFGGAVGPVLLMAGLERTGAASASILLNTELVATVVLAAVFFREHLGPRLLASTVLITGAGLILAWDSGAGFEAGAVLILAACVAWGIDNCVTAKIEHLAPGHVVALKGVIAGTANLAIGLTTTGWGANTGFGDVAGALVVGALGYGLSITLWVKGARELGAARAQVLFATAPFIGVAIAWTILAEPITGDEVLAGAIAALGVIVSLRSGHLHEHRHSPVEHDHEHDHDEHHTHLHGEVVTGSHSHAHRHDELVHAHPHVPDLHHRHDH